MLVAAPPDVEPSYNQTQPPAGNLSFSKRANQPLKFQILLDILYSTSLGREVSGFREAVRRHIVPVAHRLGGEGAVVKPLVRFDVTKDARAQLKWC